jgi:hypothetical protein
MECPPRGNDLHRPAFSNRGIIERSKQMTDRYGRMALGMTLGTGVGAAFGTALGNVGIGVAIGIAIGAAIGYVWR